MKLSPHDNSGVLSDKARFRTTKVTQPRRYHAKDPQATDISET